MIGIFVKIPFHAQIKRADPGLAEEIADAVANVSRLFGARQAASEESYFLLLDDDCGCARLRAAETARRLAGRLGPLSPRLHGWDIILGIAGKAVAQEDFQRELRRVWYEIDGNGLFLTPEAEADFAGYLELAEGRKPAEVRGFPYAEDALPAEFRRPALSSAALERFIDAAGNHIIGESKTPLVLAIGPISVAEDYLASALFSLYREAADSFLWLHAVVNEAAPYGAFLKSFAEPPSAADLALLSAPDRTVIEELAPLIRFLDSSPYRCNHPPAIQTRVRLYVAARLRIYARARRQAGLPAVLVLAGLDRFPALGMELVPGLLGEDLRNEGLVLLGTARETPPALRGLRPQVITAPPPSPVSLAESALAGAELAGDRSLGPRIAAAAKGDGFRLGLALRLAAKGLPAEGLGEDRELAAAALSTFPPEFAELLLALSISDDVLDAACLEDFLSAAGFVPGVRPLLYGQLASLGFLAPADPHPRVLRPESLRAAEAAAGSGADAVRAAFGRRLYILHGERRIHPSLALFRRIDKGDATQGRSLFYLDCLAADSLHGVSAEPEGRSVREPFEGLGPFLAAYGASDERGVDRALAMLEGTTVAEGAAPLEAAAADLARAFDAYARGEPAAAVAGAKSALIRLHDLGAPRAEVRAHRLLGLCALAQTQVQEGADYVSNAYELAEELPDPFECLYAAYAESGALLVLGDLKRADQFRRKAAEWASGSFRADWETACDFLAGRIAFELGRYEEAAEDFGKVRATARVYGGPASARRAEIWAGRTAAYSGDGGGARDLLGRHPTDAEALWFLAELSLFEGAREEAASLSARAMTLLPTRGYRSADAIDWTSGFECLEGRVLGFLGGRSYLSDQIGAFASFAAGLAGPRPELVLDIALRTREERLAALHPQAHLYHYYCYLDLEAAGGGSLDAATVLSKSFKALQTRTAHMEEAAMKNEYLERNRWNREILGAARRHKLI
jgi:hypothetical protein